MKPLFQYKYKVIPEHTDHEEGRIRSCRTPGWRSWAEPPDPEVWPSVVVQWAALLSLRNGWLPSPSSCSTQPPELLLVSGSGPASPALQTSLPPSPSLMIAHSPASWMLHCNVLYLHRVTKYLLMSDYWICSSLYVQYYVNR